MDPRTPYAIDTTAIPWEERPNERIGRALFRKVLYTDPHNGAEIRLVRYPAGVINPRYTHPCGHGMYRLEGEVMEHGAGAAGDEVVLSVTNQAFRIAYLTGP
jgi:hypothetical protein